jgi:hypothetical protein
LPSLGLLCLYFQASNRRGIAWGKKCQWRSCVSSLLEGIWRSRGEGEGWSRGRRGRSSPREGGGGPKSSNSSSEREALSKRRSGQLGRGAAGAVAYPASTSSPEREARRRPQIEPLQLQCGGGPKSRCSSSGAVWAGSGVAMSLDAVVGASIF